MDTFVIIFMIVATIFSLGSLGYVAVDVILELRNKKVPVEEIKEEPIIASTPTVDAAPPEVMPEIVEHIDA